MPLWSKPKPSPLFLMPELSVCDKKSTDSCHEKMVFPQVHWMSTYINTKCHTCEIKAVIKQSWRTREAGDKSSIIFSLQVAALLDSFKKQRLCDHWLQKKHLRPQASQHTVVHVFAMYNTQFNNLTFISCLKTWQDFDSTLKWCFAIAW